jgi:hypothetical protein
VLSERGYLDLRSTYTYHYETSAIVRAPLDRIFAHLDDHARLSGHMSKSSWMMGGGSMQVEFDAARGQNVGSSIRLSGKILGVTLAVEEIVTERTPPRRKVWETTRVPRLLVIGRYRMGFEIAPREGGSHVTVFIDYALPEGALTRWLAYFLGGYYARWCTQQMVADAVRHFASNI